MRHTPFCEIPPCANFQFKKCLNLNPVPKMAEGFEHFDFFRWVYSPVICAQGKLSEWILIFLCLGEDIQTFMRGSNFGVKTHFFSILIRIEQRIRTVLIYNVAFCAYDLVVSYVYYLKITFTNLLPLDLIKIRYFAWKQYYFLHQLFRLKMSYHILREVSRNRIPTVLHCM